MPTFNPLSQANETAELTLFNSAKKVECVPRLTQDIPFTKLLEFLNMPPLAAGLGFSLAMPSMLTLVQPAKEGSQKTGMILGAVGDIPLL